MIVLNTLLKMKNVILSIIVATVLCSVFSLFWNHEGSKATPIENVTSYRYEGKQYVSNMSEGIAFFVTDDNGYNNKQIFEKIDTLVIGSSHELATQVMQNENMTSLLNQIGSSGNTYNIAVAGQKFSDMVGFLKNAVSYFKPTEYVIIEAFPLLTSIEKMQLIIDDPYLQSQKISYNRIIHFVKEIPCVKPILYGLQNWATLKNSVGGGTPQLETTLPEGYTDTLYSFLSIVSDTAKEYNITPIIFYHPSEQLNPDGAVTYKTDPLYLDCFASTCSDLGIVFVDMTDSFKDLYATEHQLAHGFINTAVGSGHLNKYGHRVIAEKLAEVIQGLEAE